MTADLCEIEDFLHTIPPFEQLDKTCRQLLAKQIRICYYRSGVELPGSQDDQSLLYVIRKGVLAYYNLAGELLGKFTEGDLCCLFFQETEDVRVLIEEDSLVYAISCDPLREILIDDPDALAFLMLTAEQRLEQKMGRVNESALLASSLSNASIANYYKKPVITISVKACIQDAAQLMTEQDLSSLVIVDDAQPVGIVTDKDIRRRCVAKGLNPQQPVSKIMTENMATIDIKYSGYDALALMISQRIHHLPVMRRGQLVGMITATDLMNQEGYNAVNLSSAIHKANSVDELTALSQMLPKLQISIAKLGGSADYAGKNISALTMAFTKRLIELAELTLGPAPVAYAWVSAGSQARQEQLVHSDQDNALIISEAVLPEHEVWFESLARFVCDGLASCGYTYCPGNIMATNKQWRQKQSVWQRYFQRWVNQPEPQALLHCCVFFDLTTVHGDPALLQQVRSNMLRQTQNNTLFLAHLSRNALLHKPPLGFFRDFVLVQNGKNKRGLDLKHNGLLPIVNLARIYALAEGIAEVNTIERLKLAAGTPSLSRSAAANLIHAFEFLGMLRVEHQAKQLSSQQTADSYLLPKDISKLEREHLKDAFKVIKELQNYRPMV